MSSLLDKRPAAIADFCLTCQTISKLRTKAGACLVKQWLSHETLRCSLEPLQGVSRSVFKPTLQEQPEQSSSHSRG
jgi:hypothetical protein